MKPFFVIVGSQDPRGATLSVAPNAFNVEIEPIQNDEYRSYLSYARNEYVDRSLLKITAESRTSKFYHVEAQNYPEAWERLLDLWVPPDTAERTRSQILSHFTFNTV